MSPYDAVVALLVERGAESIDHPGGTLLVHLERVADRLRRRTDDEVARLGGLAHAVYGTDGFDTSLLGLEERARLRGVLGAEAEEVVYLYAACDRGRTWPSLAETGAVHDRWTGAIVRPDAELLRRFVDLSIVNEVDVCEQSAQARARYGDHLLVRFRGWRGLGSAAVLRDAEEALGGDAAPS